MWKTSARKQAWLIVIVSEVWTEFRSEKKWVGLGALERSLIGGPAVGRRSQQQCSLYAHIKACLEAQDCNAIFNIKYLVVGRRHTQTSLKVSECVFAIGQALQLQAIWSTAKRHCLN